jgi:lysine-specific histone demethylase 1
MWRDAPEDEKRPYLNETENNKRSNAASVTEFKRKLAEWDKAAVKFRKEWKEANPSVPSEDEVLLARQAELEIAEIKRSRKLNGFIDSDDEGY